MLEVYRDKKWKAVEPQDIKVGDRYRGSEDGNSDHDMFCLKAPVKVGNYYISECTTIENIKKELKNSGIKLKGVMFEL